MISTRIVFRPFTGRTDELEHLLSRRRQAGDGHGGVVLVGGEPGIGKSRLVREFRLRLNRRTATLASSGYRDFAQKPLGAVLELLAQTTPAAFADLPSSSKIERLDTLARAFEAAAAKRTTVVILEDLHWADIESLQALLVLAARAEKTRLLIVGTYRDNELTSAHPLFKWFGRLVREPAVSVITLARIPDFELDALLAGAIKGISPLAPPVLHAVRERCDGNPLFAEELLRSAVDANRAAHTGASPALPLSLHAIVAERLLECSADERSFLGHASVVGRDFEIERVCEIFETAAPPPLLDRLCSLQLIDEVDSEKRVFRFRHALTRDVIYNELPAETLRTLHLKIAEHLEKTGAGDGPEMLGHHFWAAEERGRAARYYERAGDAAMVVFAYDDAAAFYRRAAEGFGNDAAASADASAHAGRALIFAGDLDGGLGAYERA
ncbi:MAG: AAA family ATPase, partial [Candidatus Eremiobacteraeota bacterium]|nr:AAA family ATPase [Candidatus Eremiobacteraeota bacterium]